MKPGDIISSRYRAEHVLSVRGTRQRYVGQRLSDNTRVIIDTLHDSMMTNEGARRILEYEIGLSRTLSGPYFMGIIDSFTDKGKFFLIWKYVDALPLTRNDALAQLSTHDILLLVSRMVRALDIAHSHGIVHGALSTDAILVTPKLEPVIIEFAVPGVEPSTDPGVEGGISAYRAAAPELFEGEPIDESCDFYSLGFIANFLLANADDYEARTSRAIKSTISPDQDSNLSQFSHARALVNGLTSKIREFRCECAQRIIDPSFLDAMATPPGGNDVVKISRGQSRMMKKIHRKNRLNSNRSYVVLAVFFRSVIIIAAAIALLLGLAKYLH